MAETSVVVVTYNALLWIERCLDSVRGYETIVVDHGSTDGTLELVRDRFPDARLVEQENKGLGGGSNAGMRVASGDYYLLLNSDAWALDDAVEKLNEFLTKADDPKFTGEVVFQRRAPHCWGPRGAELWQKLGAQADKGAPAGAPKSWKY